MRSIIEERNIFRFAKSSHFRDGFREKEQAFAHNHQLWGNTLNQFDGLLRIDMIVILGERQIMQVDRVGTTQLERLATALNTPPKDTHRPVTDMPTRVGRVRYNGIATTQPAHGDGGIGSIAADRAHIGLSGPK